MFGVLQIILFFKIWGMTNNVKEMRDYFLREWDAKYKKAIRGNNNDDARTRNFADSVSDLPIGGIKM